MCHLGDHLVHVTGHNTFQGKFAFKRSLGEKELVISRVHKKTALFREEIRPNFVCGVRITARQSQR